MTRNLTYIQNPGWPGTFTIDEDKTCTYTFTRISSVVCQVFRKDLHFSGFTIMQPWYYVSLLCDTSWYHVCMIVSPLCEASAESCGDVGTLSLLDCTVGSYRRLRLLIQVRLDFEQFDLGPPLSNNVVSISQISFRHADLFLLQKCSSTDSPTTDYVSLLHSTGTGTRAETSHLCGSNTGYHGAPRPINQEFKTLFL